MQSSISTNAVDEEISIDDRALIENLRSRLGDDLTEFYNTDYNLLRWLIGYDRDIDKIVPLLRAHLRLRAALNFDCSMEELLKKLNPIFAEYYPKIVLKNGPDKVDNCILEILLDGRYDFEAVFQAMPASDIFISKLIEPEISLRIIMEKERLTGRRHTSVVIIDAKGCKYDSTLWAVLTEVSFPLSSLISNNYVELLHKLIYINTNHFATYCWKIAKTMIPKKTLEKIDILGEDWKQHIMTYATSDSLPVFYGGSNPIIVGRDVKTNDLNQFKMPKSIYYNSELDPTLGNLIPLTVPRNSIRTIIKEILVEEFPCDISWTLKLDSAIVFAIYFTEQKLPENNLNVSIPQTNEMSEYTLIFPELPLFKTAMPNRGSFAPKSVGFYYFQVKNSSRIFSASVQYSIEVEEI